MKGLGLLSLLHLPFLPMALCIVNLNFYSMAGILLIFIKLRDVLKLCFDQHQRKITEEEVEYLYLSTNCDDVISTLK